MGLGIPQSPSVQSTVTKIFFINSKAIRNQIGTVYTKKERTICTKFYLVPFKFSVIKFRSLTCGMPTYRIFRIDILNKHSK